ncbi:MAG: nucleoside deaminase [Acidimicrobiia bacterium]
MNPEAVAAAMDVALAEADAAVQHGDVPIGAVIVERTTGRIIAARHNERELLNDPCAHAEVLALRDAARIVGSWRLDEYACVVTLEPCPMCAGALVNARIGAVVFGAGDQKAGALGSVYNLGADPRLNHEFPIQRGLRSEDAAALLTAFFTSRR